MNKKTVALIVLFVFYFAQRINGQVVVIANKNVSVKSIDLGTLINLYTMRSNELGTEKVKLLFNNSESAVSTKFLSAIQKTSTELKKIWLRARLTNSGFSPQTVSSDSEMLEKVYNSQHTIGFIDLKSVTKDVKILLRIE